MLERLFRYIGVDPDSFRARLIERIAVAIIFFAFTILIVLLSSMGKRLVFFSLTLPPQIQNTVGIEVAKWMGVWVVLTPFLLILLVFVGLRWLSAEGVEDSQFVSQLLSNLQHLLDFVVEARFSFSEARLNLLISKNGKDDNLQFTGEIKSTQQPFKFLEIPHGSTEPLERFPIITTHRPQGTATCLPFSNQKQLKKCYLIFSPDIAAGERFSYSFTWPNFWNPLRKTGEDYYEYECLRTCDKILIEINSQLETPLEWLPSVRGLAGLTAEESLNGYKLTATILNPTIGSRYRLAFKTKKKGGN